MTEEGGPKDVGVAFRVLQATDGNFYGMTATGGTSNTGTVYGFN